MACDGGIVERVQELLVGHGWVSKRLMFDGLALSAMKGLLDVVSEAPILTDGLCRTLNTHRFYLRSKDGNHGRVQLA